MPSARARAVNLAFRHSVKRSLGGDTSVESLRRFAHRFDGVIGSAPRGVRARQMDRGEFTAEWISTSDAACASMSSRVLLYLPGGGFVIRSPGLHRAMVARISRAARADAMLTFYRLAPEHPYPAALDDCVAAYQYLLDEGVHPSRIVIGGDSAGGCLTLTTLMALRDRGVMLPAAAFTLSAVTDLRGHHNGSRTDNARSDCVLAIGDSERWHGYFVGDQLDRLADPLVSPVLGDFTGLPPLLMQASTSEILLDDSTLAAERAREANVDCRLELYEGVNHVWHALAWLPEARRAVRSVGAFIRHHTAS